MNSHDIKKKWAETLTKVIDEPLSREGFRRKGNSPVYQKSLESFVQTINFELRTSPKAYPEAIAKTYPLMLIKSPVLSEVLQSILGAHLQSEWSHQIVLNQDAEHCVLNLTTYPWLVFNETDFQRAAEELRDIAVQPIIEFCEQYSTFDGILNGCIFRDWRFIAVNRYILYAIAAAIKIDELQIARSIFQYSFKSSVAKRKFAPLGDYLTSK